MIYVPCKWRDGAFHPHGGWHVNRCEENFGGGELLMISAEHERDMISHRKQFAVIRTAWRNLPDSLRTNDWAASSDTLRKYALIRCGYANLEHIVCGSKAAAERVGAYVGNLARQAHGYAIVSIEDKAVRCWTPQSQAVSAMGGDMFLQSKTDITAFCADLLGVAAADLEAMGRKEAA